MGLLPTRLTKAGLLGRLSPIAAAVLLLGCTSGRVILGPNATNPAVKRIAVLDFDYHPEPMIFALVYIWSPRTDAGRFIPDQVSGELLGLGRYDVI